MKKLVSGLLLMTGFALASQAQKGSILLYGNVGFHSEKNSGVYKSNNFNINPGIGYQFTNHWTAGLDLGYAQNKTKSSSSASFATNKSYNAGLFARYTQPLGSIFSIFGQGNAGYISTENFAGIKRDGFGTSIFPAVGINVHNGLALNFSFGGVSFESIKGNGTGTSTVFDLNFGQQAHIGISKNFGGKKN